MFTLGRRPYAERDNVEDAVGKHDKPDPEEEAQKDGQAPGMPKEPDPGKHGKK